MIKWAYFRVGGRVTQSRISQVRMMIGRQMRYQNDRETCGQLFGPKEQQI